MRIHFLDIPIDCLTTEETVERALEAMRTRTRTQHVALNVAKLVNSRSDEILRRDLIASDIVGVDGAGIVLGLRLANVKVERVSGIDLMEQILARCAAEGFRPFFLGATAQVVRQATDNVLKRYPDLRFAGLHDGYFTADQEKDIIEFISTSGADCLFVGIPTPRKERLLLEYRDVLSVPFIMGVGGSFDVLAGKLKRAPFWMQNSGLEWLYRVYQEPRRMWWRYFRTNTVYAALLTGVVLQRLAGRAIRGQ